jgi:hypothetical protein
MLRVSCPLERGSGARFDHVEAEKYMGRTLETDLTEIEGNPTAGAVVPVALPHELCTLKVTVPMRRGRATIQLDTQTLAGSPLGAAITTVLLIAAGCLLMGVATLVSAPVWAVIGSPLMPASIFMIIRFIPRNEQTEITAQTGQQDRR